MMSTRRYLALWGLLVSVVLAVALACTAPAAPRAPAATATALPYNRPTNPRPAMIELGGPITQSTAFNWSSDWIAQGYGSADVYYAINQGPVSTVTLPNTLTLSVQVSPNRTAWLSHGVTSTLVNGSAVDVSGYAVIPAQMPWFRITATLANTRTVTATLQIYLR